VALVAVACACASVALAAPQRFTVPLGGTFTATGHTGSLKGQTRRATGLVVVHGRWTGGRWYVLTTTKTDRLGNYRFTIKPRHHGTLLLRIVPPDKQERRFLLRVD
jgi:hypothetical protein